ncbi:putative Ras GTPase-activating protein-binding protein [Helianthus annuus]|nr:putative Ras GTPase-activating protein-binding protein [Helianthus annuus]
MSRAELVHLSTGLSSTWLDYSPKYGQEILQEFKNFGRIKQDGVFIKNRKDVGICFAFVEFEDMSGVQKAIEASPIQIAGKQVYIEERRANSSTSSRGGSMCLLVLLNIISLFLNIAYFIDLN